jgi:hypothetical protein
LEGKKERRKEGKEDKRNPSFLYCQKDPSIFLTPELCILPYNDNTQINVC